MIVKVTFGKLDHFDCLLFLREFIIEGSLQPIRSQFGNECCFFFCETLLIKVPPIAGVHTMGLLFSQLHILLAMPAKSTKFRVVE